MLCINDCVLIWSVLRDLNPRSPGPKPGAIPNFAKPGYSVLAGWSRRTAMRMVKKPAWGGGAVESSRADHEEMERNKNNEKGCTEEAMNKSAAGGNDSNAASNRLKSENTQSVPVVSKLQSEAKPSPNVLADCFGVLATSILYRNVTKNASPNLRGNANSVRPAKRVEALGRGPPVDLGKL